jgi:hypothetical protein
MKRTELLLPGLITGILLTLGLLLIGPVRNSRADSAGSHLAQDTGSDELPPGDFSEGMGPEALPTSIPGETLVYFATTDSDATATVLYLLNTDSVAHTVALRGYGYNGVLGYSLNISVAATSLLRLSSDSIAAAPPPSWATPAPIITNFTDFTYFASLSLPKGVKVEGYYVYNGGTGTVDPRADQGALPIRFSTDPATVFLPLALNGP